MVGLVALGLVLTRVLHHSGARVSESRAVAIAQPEIDFRPDGHNIRLVRRGIPPHPFWAVSFWTRKPGGGYDRITIVVVDANNGNVTEVKHAS